MLKMDLVAEPSLLVPGLVLLFALVLLAAVVLVTVLIVRACRKKAGAKKNIPTSAGKEEK